MKQVLQNRKEGKTAVADVPVPAVRRGGVLVRTVASVISAGTERSAVETARKSLVQKASERPDLVKKVFEKARTEGLRNAFNAVRDKLAESVALGNSAAGVVMATGEDVTGFMPGDRVACAGLGFASHAEVLSVPKNLCVRLPDKVDFEAGAFGTIGAIALQGVRLAEPTLGESVVVIGLGLLGQLTLQLLQANGCRVFCIDPDPARRDLAQQFGADVAVVPEEEIRDAVMNWTRGRGADAVLITAATDSNQPIELAGEISRLKGRVVVVGMTGLAVPRQSYYLRELSLRISMSYGPGRYDPAYEELGYDYPIGYVRWTENRNIEAFLDLVAQGRIDLGPLISHRFGINEAERAYELIAGDLSEPYLGVVLNYDSEGRLNRDVELATVTRPQAEREKSVRLGVIGAGSYVPAMLLPHFKSAGAEFISIATASGVSALDVGKKFEFQRAVSDAEQVINDENVNLVLVGTRHDLHAQLAVKVLERNKHVFVEKPLALNDGELDEVIEAASRSRAQLMVGFNRRFSPLALKAREFFADRRAPLSILYRVNAGRITADHWVHDPIQGGGRIVAEVCHFVDLMQFWTGAPPISVYAAPIAGNRHDVSDHDSVFITLRFADGSNGCIAYLAEGDKKLAKERVEIFCEQKTFVLDDFRHANTYANGHEEKTALRAVDKGQAEEVRAACAVVLEGRAAPISLRELEAATRATFRIKESLQTGQPREC
jgi:predicted dehydrogenase/threonine dehydrogenase-like Zn-dependent dehydrogenase